MHRNGSTEDTSIESLLMQGIDKVILLSFCAYSCEINNSIAMTCDPFDSTYAFKQAKRKTDDIAIVMSVIRMRIIDNIIADAAVVFGGIVIPQRFTNVEQYLVGKQFTEATFSPGEIIPLLEQNTPKSITPTYMQEYKEVLCASFLKQFYLIATNEIQPFNKPPSKSLQEYDTLPSNVRNYIKHYDLECCWQTNSSSSCIAKCKR